MTLAPGPEGPEALVLRVRFDSGGRVDFLRHADGFYVCDGVDYGGPTDALRIADNEDGLLRLAAELHRLACGGPF